MLMPSIFGENLFDDFFTPFYYDDKDEKKAEKKLYGRRAGHVMKTDIKEKDNGYEFEIDLPGFTKDEVKVSLENGYMTIEAAKGLDKDEKEKETGKGLFREGDKVMQIRNNYQLEWEIRGKYGIAVEKGVGVFNGDMGIIEEINTFAETLTVVFEENRYVEYSFKQLDELELAYAVTIHKSQGSEYPAVILPLLGGPRMLMSRNLLYTAVTRARTCVTILGSEVTFEEMIRNKQEKERYTSLRQRIEEMNEQ